MYTVCIIVVNDDIFVSLIDAECESLSNYTLPAIPHKDKVLCHIPSSCDQVSCCVYMAPVRRHARVDLVVNTCSYQMEAVIDNLRFTRSLFTYTWGKICNLKCMSFRLNSCYNYSLDFLILFVCFTCIGTNEEIGAHGVLKFG